MTESVVVERHGHVAVVRINRPEARNAIDQGVWDGLGAAWDEADHDRDVRAVVLTGTGSRAFSAGADLKAIAGGGYRTDWSQHQREQAWGFAGIVNHPISKPTIAAVNGLAFGGGFELVLACDLVVAADTATIGLPEVRRGLIAAGGGAVRLPQRMPRAIAMELLLTGDPIDAARAAAWGLVNAVTDPGRELGAAIELAERIAQNAPLAVQATKRIASRRDDSSVDHEDWTDNEAQMRALMRSDDAREGPRAFAEKRAPIWTAG